ncbi:DUF881 domain-containing protein [Nocardioides sp. AE5]|uniref:DUF881 domain-containing protein n=1 Tax=Nocardioides sp. AE5 TaxID=2962573 RepID=UPI0028812EA7|nr:DUF881 domain-containing protein [Nocardioides sp. AE5]MDT0201585.1 DUF881 domain-containing protein [Nocardioides sp. AE5]
MAEQRKLPEHVVMPLLTRITVQSMDGDYQHVADRKAATGEETSRPHSLRNAAIVVAIFGLMLMVALVQTERNAEDNEAGRQRLISSINQQRATLATSQERVSELRAAQRELDAEVEATRDAERAVNSAIADKRILSGYTTVQGDGVRITVNDSPDGSADGRVRDEDLALLVDGLWAAGAEAISINGHRLTVLTGIRNVGVAVHIKAQPLKPPYVVLAIGDPNTLQSLFVESASGMQFNALANGYGFDYQMQNAQGLVIGAARGPRLRSAEVNTKRPPGWLEGTP